MASWGIALLRCASRPCSCQVWSCCCRWWRGPRRAQSEITFDDALALSEAEAELRAANRALQARAEGDAPISDVMRAAGAAAPARARLFTEADRGFEGQFGVLQGWNLAGLGGARRRAADGERAALAAERRAMALSRRLGAARAWLELAVLERQVLLAAAEAELAATLRERIDRAAALGEMTRADSSEALAFEGEAGLRIIAAEGQRLSALLALATAMGVLADERARTGGPAPAPTVPEREAARGAAR